MSEKQFELICESDEFGNEMWNVFNNAPEVNDVLSCEEVVDLLNNLTEENEELKKGKERYELLYRHAEEEISNRILSIKEHIENCSDEQVKQSLQELFYSEVNEYDISKENRRLRTENDELKVSINNLCNEINEKDTMTSTEILVKLMNILNKEGVNDEF